MADQGDLLRRPAPPPAAAGGGAASGVAGSRLRGLGAALNGRPSVVAQRKLADARADGTGLLQRRQVAGGLPEGLRRGAEALSGIALDDVRVHYNSAEPVRLGALAHAQGSDIHLGPGQAHHLPHEAWHVVQQKQGRVRATRQLKAGTAINDDAGLEAEADAMGARAARLGAGLPEPLTAPPRQMAMEDAPAQLYTEQPGLHISDDRTAAVGTAVNNKIFYATATRVDEANEQLVERSANIRLAMGAQRLLGATPVRRVTPVIDDASVVANAQHASLVPQADAGSETGVLLPSACEKGAIAVIGAFMEEQRAPQNAFAYARKDHSRARIGNLIARSAAGAMQKQAWYDDWARLEGLAGNAAAAQNALNRTDRFNAAATNIDAVRAEIRATDAGLADTRFDAQFELDGGDYRPRVSRASSFVVTEAMIRFLDEQMNAIERAVMSDVDPHYAGYHQNVLDAVVLRDRLIALYTAADYPRTLINDALTLVGRTGERATYLKDKPNDPANYQTNLWYNTETRMRTFIQSVASAITVEIVRLRQRRDARFGAGPGVNEAVDPKVGQAYGIIGGHYDYSDHGRWNWHWAGVILKTSTDNVTMEAHATHQQGNELFNERWDFKMYGRPHVSTVAGQTFHERQRTDGFGAAPVTVLGYASVVADPSEARYHLAGLGRAEVERYKQGTLDLFTIERYLKDMARSKDEIVAHYFGRQTEMLDLLRDDLPQPFVQAELAADFATQLQAVTELRDGGHDRAAELDLEVDISDAATDLIDTLREFYSGLERYEARGRKTGFLA